MGACSISHESTPRSAFAFRLKSGKTLPYYTAIGKAILSQQATPRQSTFACLPLRATHRARRENARGVARAQLAPRRGRRGSRDRQDGRRAFDSLEHLLAVVREPRRPRLGKLAEQLLGRFHGVLGGSLERQNKRVDCLGVAQLAQNHAPMAVQWAGSVLPISDERRMRCGSRLVRYQSTRPWSSVPAWQVSLQVPTTRLISPSMSGSPIAPRSKALAQQIGAQPNRVAHGVFVVGDVLRVCHGRCGMETSCFSARRARGESRPCVRPSDWRQERRNCQYLSVARCPTVSSEIAIQAP